MATPDSAISIGDQFRRFWRWWTGELRALIPAGLEHWLTRLRVAPLVLADSEGFGIYRFDGTQWKRKGGVTGDSSDALAKNLGAELRRLGIDRFGVGLKAGQFLSKSIALPQAAEENVRNALRYELDRHTPFKPDEVGFDCCVTGRDDKSREIAVTLVIAPKTTISAAVASVAGTGLLVTAVQPGLPDRSSLPINLLPHEENGNGNLLRLKRWLPWGLLALLGIGALVLPIYQKRAQVIELQPQVNIAAQQAQAADVLHQQLDRAQSEYNFVLQKRYATPTSLQLLAEVTRILPDDTWLQSFELRTVSKGRELQLQGETGVAGKMIELFEQSPLLTGASFKSPVTQAPGSQASRFHVGMDVKDVPPPPSRVLAAAVDSAAVATPAPGAPAVPAIVAATGVPGSNPAAAVTSPAVPAAAALPVGPGSSPAAAKSAAPGTGSPSSTPPATAPGAPAAVAGSGKAATSGTGK